MNGVNIIQGVSIHAPARGATSVRLQEIMDKDVSIHAPARGATCQVRRIQHNPRSFNPRSRAGSDYHTQGTFTREVSFNPRSRAGSDHGIINYNKIN